MAICYTIYAILMARRSISVRLLNGHIPSFNPGVVAVNYFTYIVTFSLQIASQIFHITSILTTTLLSVQKVLIINIPLWSKVYLTGMYWHIAVIFSFFLSVLTYFFHAEKMWSSIYERKANCCQHKTYIDDDSAVGTQITGLPFSVLCGIVFTCTITVIFKLICLRRNLTIKLNFTIYLTMGKSLRRVLKACLYLCFCRCRIERKKENTISARVSIICNHWEWLDYQYSCTLTFNFLIVVTQNWQGKTH